MSQQVSIHTTEVEDSRRIVIGEHTLNYQKRLSLLPEEKETVCREACEILSRCIPPGQLGCVTNLAVGYVQSGKTMSFTTLTTLAADNGYRIIIYLTGTKTNLQNQTATRLKTDLGLDEDGALDYNIIENIEDARILRMLLLYTDGIILIPILKHYKHINNLAQLFQSPDIKSCIGDSSVLIIDDEADQASLNTYAHKNCKKEDWEEDEQSRTYESIIFLKRTLPNHSYIQYTATPQSLLMIDADDILSPKYHTVLTPGKEYTGGNYFFKQAHKLHIRRIPDIEVESSKNPLSACPDTLIFALQQFIISVICKVFIRKEVPYLSMMVHIDGTKNANEKYKRWIDALLMDWADLTVDSVNRDLFKQELQPAYDDLATTIENCPPLDEIFSYFLKALLNIKTPLVHSGADTEIDWKTAKGFILVGANMLNRGFTVEKLSMTFMPRTNSTTATADTIEQRCRFFGYKKKYLDVCRIYVSEKAKQEFTDYVDHEEILRDALKRCPNHTIAEYKEQAKALIISHVLKPTRKNVLSKNYVKHQMSSWKQYNTSDFLRENLDVMNVFVQSHIDDFINAKDYGHAKRNHRYVDVSIEDAIKLLSAFQFYNAELRDRRSATIQYLRYVLENNAGQGKVRVYQMAFDAVRSRTLKDDLKPGNLQAGESIDGGVAYPGDRSFKSDDFLLTIQLHHIKIDDPQYRVAYHCKETCNLAIYYPDGLSFDYYEY